MKSSTSWFIIHAIITLGFVSVRANYAKTDENCTIEMKEECTSGQEVCKDVPVEECHEETMTVYRDEVKKECEYVPEMVCQDHKSKHCQVVQKPVRKVISVRECKTVPKTVCDNTSTSQRHTHTDSPSTSYEMTGDHHHSGEHPHKPNHDHCVVVLRETCRPVPEEQCEDVAKNVTRTETVESCEMVSVQECEVQNKTSCNETYEEVSVKHYSTLSHSSSFRFVRMKQTRDAW